MSKSLSTLVNQNTFASTSANLCTQREYWMENFCNLLNFTLWTVTCMKHLARDTGGFYFYFARKFVSFYAPRDLKNILDYGWNPGVKHGRFFFPFMPESV